MNLQNKTVVIEGLPASGKTQLLEMLRLCGCDTIPEIAKTIKPEDFPGNGQNIDEVLAIDDWFIGKENERMCSLGGIFERSWISNVVYSYAYARHMKLQSMRPTIEKYQQALTSGRLRFPDVIVFIEVAPMVSSKRQSLRIASGKPTMGDFWLKENFLSDTNFAYKTLFSCCSNVHILRISGERQAGENAGAVIEFLGDLHDTCTTSFVDLNRFINKMSEKE